MLFISIVILWIALNMNAPIWIIVLGSLCVCNELFDIITNIITAVKIYLIGKEEDDDEREDFEDHNDFY